MKKLSFLLAVVMVMGAAANADILQGMLMGEGLYNVTLYGHGAAIVGTDHAPGTFSAECSEHMDDGFWGIVSVGNVDDLIEGDKFTWTTWLKVDSATWVSSEYAGMAASTNDTGYLKRAGEWKMWIEDTTRNARFLLGEGSDTETDIIGSPIPMDTWVHYAVTYDSGSLTMYINGSVDAAGTSSLTYFPALTGREMSVGSSAGNQKWRGWIDEIAWFDKALTQSQIQYVIDNGLAAFLALPPVPDECGDSGTQYLLADIDKNCYVNALDLLDFMSEWLQEGPPEAPIPIANDSFEDDDIADGVTGAAATVSGWTDGSLGNIYVYDPSDAQWLTRYDAGQTIPDGQQVLWFDDPAGRIRQMLTETVQADTIYQFKVDVGSIIDAGNSWAELKLVAIGSSSNVVLLDVNIYEDSDPVGQGTRLVQGQWLTQTLQFNSTNFPAAVGYPIKIILKGQYVDMDNVRLEKAD